MRSARRHRLTIGLAVLPAMAVIAGCAQRRETTVAAAPAPAELPRFSYIEPVLPVHVEVEGRHGPRYPLVPELKPPELTPEERAVLGEREELVKLLLYPSPTRPPDSHVAPWRSELEIHNWGLGGASIYVWDSPSIVGVSSDFAGAAIAVDQLDMYRRGIDPVVKSLYGVGHREGVKVDIGHTQRIADHRPNIER